MTPHATSPSFNPSTHLDPSIPLVDLSPFTSSTGTPESRLSTARSLVKACQDVGFVYIRGHGVPHTELNQAFAISKSFFDLPRSQKMKAPHPPGWAVHRGYSWPGFEKVSGVLSNGTEHEDEERVKQLRSVPDFKESYEIGSEQNRDQPNIWPPSSPASSSSSSRDEDGNPDPDADPFPLAQFRPFMTTFYWTLFRASTHILRALALGLNLPESTLLDLHSGHNNQLRLLHYPPIAAEALEGGKSARMPAHTDWSSMTILFQDECGGLQVQDRRREGRFVDVAPVEGTCVMNVGDLLMRWSNDTLTSTQHRVTSPPLQDRFTGTDRLTKARYSIPYFCSTDPDLVIECLASCVGGGQGEAKYEPITQREYSAMRARMQY